MGTITLYLRLIDASSACRADGIGLSSSIGFLTKASDLVCDGTQFLSIASRSFSEIILRRPLAGK